MAFLFFVYRYFYFGNPITSKIVSTRGNDCIHAKRVKFNKHPTQDGNQK